MVTLSPEIANVKSASSLCKLEALLQLGDD